jgi:adenylate cyclase
LFADMRGFTQLAQVLNDPQSVQTIVNEFLTLWAREILGFEGIVNKFMGDGIFAFFRGENAEERAVSATFSIIEKFLVLRDKWDESHNQDLAFVDIGIGIATDYVILGSVRSGGVRDFTAMGSAVNLATALEHAARGICKECVRWWPDQGQNHRMRVLVDQNTYSEVKQLIEPPCEYRFKLKKPDQKTGHDYKRYHVTGLKLWPGMRIKSCGW